MADYRFQDHSFPLQPKPTSRNNRGKFFCSNFLLRLLLIALFLCAIPLFTSEAPDFISHTVFAKSWELVHLFIIGILVSYGLFGRRRTQTQMGIQTPPAFNSPNMLHASTIFNFEHQNPSGYSVYGNDNVNQAYDFRPYGLEPTVVVRPGTCDFEYEPLDLPVRSLRSRVEESESEDYATESEMEADASSNCRCSEEDNESENLEENDLVGSSSPTPWNWPNSAQYCYLPSPCVDNSETNQACYENPEHSLSTQSSPLCSSPSELPSMDVEVESSRSGPTYEESVLNSQPSMADPKEEASDVCFVRESHEVKHVKTRSFRVSSSKGSSPFSPCLSESPPMEVENSRMENVDTKLRTSPTSSLKSRSMRVDFKEKVGDVSLHADTQCQNLPHSQVSSTGFSPLCSVASRSPTTETEDLQRDSKSQSLQSLSFRSPKSVSPMCDLMPHSAVSESPPTPAIEMENLQTETEKVDDLLNEMSQNHTFSPDSDFHLKRVGSRSRRSRKRDGVKGEMKSRTDSLRSESSCDTTSSQSPSPSTSSHHFTSAIEPKQSPETGLSKQVEMNASRIDIVLPTESSRLQLDSGSSVNKDERKNLSRTLHSRRLRKRDDVKGEMKPRTDSLRSESSGDTTSSPSPITSSHHFTSTIEPTQSPEICLSKEVEINASKNDFVLETESSRIQLCASSSLNKDGRKTLSRTSHSRRFRKRDDVKGEMKPRTDSLRSESSGDTTSSPSPITSSHHFTSTIEQRQSPEICLSSEVEINASKNDFVLATESSRIQLGASSSLNKDGRKTLSRTSHSRRFSIGSLFDRDNSKEITKKVKDENGGNNSGKCGWDCLKLDVKPILTKNSLRGKSVRTVRPQAITLEPSCTNEISSKQKTDERVRERQDVVIISIGISEKNNGRNQKCTTTKNEKGESSSLELGKNKERSSVVEVVNEDEDCNSEIDRKADEFIAKFKEQIRLQKVASRRVSSKH